MVCEWAKWKRFLDQLHTSSDLSIFGRNQSSSLSSSASSSSLTLLNAAAAHSQGIERTDPAERSKRAIAFNHFHFDSIKNTRTQADHFIYQNSCYKIYLPNWLEPVCSTR